MSLLLEIAVFLAAAVLAVPLFRRLGLGAVLGYLTAGVVIGPWGLRLVTEVQDMLHLGEIGVVFLLFIIGLELQPSRLRAMRRRVFGPGAAQVLITAALLAPLASLLGLGWKTAIVVALALSLSSTAFVLQLLAESHRLKSRHGRSAFGLLLFQDMAVIPMIAALPLLAPTEMKTDAVGIALDAGLVVLVVVGFVVGGRYLLRPLLRMAAAARSHEIFTAAALLLVLGAAVLMDSIGISMGLGAFLAGVLVADSEFRHQLETDIKPFEGLLLGLFFMAVGMGANVGLLLDRPLAVLGLAAALIAVKAVVLYGIGRWQGLPDVEARRLAMVLAQGGEFAFVLIGAAAAQALVAEPLADLVIMVVTVSMVATPLLIWLHDRLSGQDTAAERPFDTVGDTDHQVIIAGFGRFGQMIGRLLASRRIPFTALEANPTQVDFVRQFGNEIYYGDATRLNLLRSARVDHARVFVLAVDEVEASLRIARLVRHHFPDLKLYARARNRQHAHRLMDLGCAGIIRETVLSSQWLGGQVLHGLGLSKKEAAEAVEIFRAHDERTLARQRAIRDDRDALIQSGHDAARELRELFEQDASSRDSQRSG